MSQTPVGRNERLNEPDRTSGAWLPVREAVRKTGSLERLYRLARDGMLRSRETEDGDTEVWISDSDAFSEASIHSESGPELAAAAVPAGLHDVEARMRTGDRLSPATDDSERHLQLAREIVAFGDRLSRIEHELELLQREMRSGQRMLALAAPTRVLQPTASALPPQEAAPPEPSVRLVVGSSASKAPTVLHAAVVAASSHTLGIFFASFLVVVLVAELGALSSPYVGLVAHLIVLLGLAALALSPLVRLRDIAITLMIAPLTRIVSLGLGLSNVPLMYMYILGCVPYLACCILVVRRLQLRGASIGLTAGNIGVQVPIGTLGIAIGSVRYLVLHPAPIVSSSVDAPTVLAIVLLLFLAALIQEMLFRGILQAVVIEALGSLGILFLGALFAVLSVSTGSSALVFIALVVGLTYSAIVARTKSLFGVVLAEGVANSLVLVILPYIYAR